MKVMAVYVVFIFLAIAGTLYLQLSRMP